VNSGIYIAILHLPKTAKITVGKLGTFNFTKGFYFYVGSAQRSLSTRLERHAKKKKSLRWHIDYLSVKAEMLGAIAIPGSREFECQLAKKLSNMFEPTVLSFGASDCKCTGHLFYARELP
jgi:sugar fermentation stimulation protein A